MPGHWLCPTHGHITLPHSCSGVSAKNFRPIQPPSSEHFRAARLERTLTDAGLLTQQITDIRDRVVQVITDIEAGMHATGSRDFGRGMAFAAKQVKAAMNGGAAL